MLPDPVQCVVLTCGRKVWECLQQPPVEPAVALCGSGCFFTPFFHKLPEGNAFRQTVLIQVSFQGSAGFLGLLPHFLTELSGSRFGANADLLENPLNFLKLALEDENRTYGDKGIHQKDPGDPGAEPWQQ